MRYGRLFTPGTDAAGGRGMSAARAGRKAFRLAVGSGLLYAEGYAGYPQAWGLSSLWAWAWCLRSEEHTSELQSPC